MVADKMPPDRCTELDQIRLAALENLGLGVFGYTVDGTVLFADKGALRIIDLLDRYPDPEQVKGRKLSELFKYVDGEGRLRNALGKHKKVTGYEYRFMTLSGHERWVRHDSALIEAKGDQPAFVYAVVVDITQYKLMESTLRQTQYRLLHPQKLESLGLMAGGLAHDFNNLLVAILGNADLALMDLPPGAPIQVAIEQIRNAAVRASELTNQMLAYSGRGRFIVGPVELNSLVTELGDLLNVAMSKGISLESDLTSYPTTVSSEHAQLQQVVLNMVTNASEAIGDGQGRVSITTRRRELDRSALDKYFLSAELPEGSYVVLSVSDDGQGMDRETMAKMFDPFFSTKEEGRGLGLASVLGIIRSHRGALWVDSKPGQGTTVEVILPAQDPTPAQLPTTQELMAYQGSGKVLVIDDEHSVLQVARDMLHRLGLEVVTARDGLEGMELFTQNRSELVAVMLDMTMPRQGGAETFSQIRELDPDIPVIMCSGYSEADSLERFGGESPSGYLQKPFEIKMLSQVLRQVLPDLDKA